MDLTLPISTKLADPEAERVHQNTDRRILELQRLPLASAVPIVGVVLPNQTDTFVYHHLGREPVMILLSPPYPQVNLAGQILELRNTTTTGTPIDRASAIVLRAFGWGITINVDVLVF